MYAVIASGGKQYKVSEGDVLDLEKLAGDAGDTLELPVLMLSDGDRVLLGADELAASRVTAEIVEQRKGEKILVFKLKKRKRYHRTRGHRQELTRVKIVGISA